MQCPAVSTVHAVLDRHGLVTRKKRRRYKAEDIELNSTVRGVGVKPQRTLKTVLPKGDGSLEHQSKPIKCCRQTAKRTTERDVRISNTG